MDRETYRHGDTESDATRGIFRGPMGSTPPVSGLGLLF